MTDETKGLKSDSDQAALPRSISPPKPACKLIGMDGNVLASIGRVRRTLEADGHSLSAPATS